MPCEICKNSTSSYCRICNPMTIYEFASCGGKKKSAKKKKSSRLNGKKGGRPKRKDIINLNL